MMKQEPKTVQRRSLSSIAKSFQACSMRWNSKFHLHAINNVEVVKRLHTSPTISTEIVYIVLAQCLQMIDRIRVLPCWMNEANIETFVVLDFLQIFEWNTFETVMFTSCQGGVDVCGAAHLPAVLLSVLSATLCKCRICNWQHWVTRRSHRPITPNKRVNSAIDNSAINIVATVAPASNQT